MDCIRKQTYQWGMYNLKIVYKTWQQMLCMAIGFAVLPGVFMYVSYMGELTVWMVFPTIAIRMYRSSPLVPLDSCLTAAACLSSAC